MRIVAAGLKAIQVLAKRVASHRLRPRLTQGLKAILVSTLAGAVVGVTLGVVEYVAFLTELAYRSELSTGLPDGGVFADKVFNGAGTGVVWGFIVGSAAYGVGVAARNVYGAVLGVMAVGYGIYLSGIIALIYVMASSPYASGFAPWIAFTTGGLGAFLGGAYAR